MAATPSPGDGIVKWGILSTAKIGKKVVPGIRAARNCQVVAVAGRDLAKARAAAVEYGCARAYGSYKELLADPDIHAVYIPLPNSLHAEWTIKAAAAGKHVLCEKPLASDADQARQVVEACRAAGVLLMEAFMYRFHPLTQTVKRTIADGAIGEILTVRGAFAFPLTDPSNIRLKPELAGGALMDVGCYPVNLARFLFGAEPERVFAVSRNAGGGGVDLTLTALLQFPRGRSAIIECSFEQQYRCEYEVVGSTGRIRVAEGFIRTPIETGFDIIRGDRTERVPVAPASVYQLQAEHFADAVLRGGPIPPPGEDGLANMRALTALYRSAASENAVTVETE